MARKLLYSERKAMAETGSLGPLTEGPTPALRRAIEHLMREGFESVAGGQFRAGLERTGALYLGWKRADTPLTALSRARGDDFLDLVEVIVQEGRRRWKFPHLIDAQSAIPNVEQEINDLFDRHRFGYRIESNEIRKVGSPALDQMVVGPALISVKRTGWEEAERSFKEAIHHQRGGKDENDDALTAANAAIEAALKAAGFKGANLGPLAKEFKKSSIAPAELRDVPGALDVLLKRSSAIRNSHGDSHGKAPGSDPVPQELVDLAIHWAGAFIVYLSQAIPAQD